ncbi:hypothetical protein CWB41_04665 [Methylovirgula ligni]|uniref:Uncharacterized protein n=1 Tax=Methylovirgula ligni TaxID=569860 RepID=A0A3D9Z3E6_9HYPH|nr:hypothetical protein [Methylovirgula ligni]QAY95107.1 hypothetical protein CWB41_04665 [Methylovirgula ligni]REF89611.1 hypothetical protein DES32_0838 [Methylovirgula ligni]
MAQLRTPRDHADDTAKIMKALPKNDSDITPAPRHVERPRHRDLADELRPLLDWRRLSNPDSSAWCAPDNDNERHVDEDGVALNVRDVEAEWEIRPTVNEIMNAVEEGGTKAALKLWKKDDYGTPYGAEQERDEDRKVAIAALKYLLAYVQGTPVAPAERHDPRFTPPGIGAPESPRRRALRDLAASLGVTRDVPLDEARKRWNLPPVANDNEPAFPWRPADPREIFYTGRVRSNPDARQAGPENDGISRRQGALQEAAHLRGKLSRHTVKALDIAIEAQNFAEVGAAFGFLGKNAERRGKQLVLESCAELKAALAKG